MAHALNFAHIRISEPGGLRTFDTRVTVGGDGADVVVPGCPAGAQLRFEREDAIWLALPLDAAAVRFNGAVLAEPRDVRTADVLNIGAAQLVLSEVTRTLLRIDVQHRSGNETIPPAALISEPPVEAEDLEIRVATLAPSVAAAPPKSRRRPPFKYFVIATLLLALLLVLTAVETLSVDVVPADARVSVPGTHLSVLAGGHLYVFPGLHTIRAERAGYRPAQTAVVAQNLSREVIHLRLLKLPGLLAIDTRGVQATVLIDGVEMGQAPGEVQAPAGSHTLVVRAPRYLDFVATVSVTGANQKQSVSVMLRPSWGTLVVASDPASARIQIDGAESGIAPASLDLPAGMHHLALFASGYRAWESSVVLRPGESLQIGPVKLGEPDASLNVRTHPPGATVAVAGSFRGHTPLRVLLPAGIDYEVVVSLPGRVSDVRSVFAKAGSTLTIDAALAESAGSVKVSGEPADAEVFVDGVLRGVAPQRLDLDSADHKIEVRKAGYSPYSIVIAASPGLERTVAYQLGLPEKSIALQESAATIMTGSGYALRLIRGGTVRRAAVSRPFYIGVNAVSNADFRHFRAAHTSGRRALDLPDQPVVQVSWDDAAEFCNWLSARDGLPPAYEGRGGVHALRRPVTSGYRLPTAAEWEYSSLSGRAASEWTNDSSGERRVVLGAEPEPRDASAQSQTLGFRIARYAEVGAE